MFTTIINLYLHIDIHSNLSLQQEWVEKKKKILKESLSGSLIIANNLVWTNKIFGF